MVDSDDDGRIVKVLVPGATTIKVQAFLNSLPRWLLKTPCSLQGFLRSFLLKPKDRDGPTSSSCSTWPMPIPYPDWYILGMPAAVPGWLRLGASLSSRQWSVVKR